jgi:hypothetical protein
MVATFINIVAMILFEFEVIYRILTNVAEVLIIVALSYFSQKYCSED